MCSEFYSGPRHLERPHLSPAPFKFTKRRWVFTLITEGRTGLGESLSRPVTTLSFHAQAAFSLCKGEPSEWEKSQKQIIHKLLNVGSWMNCIVSLKQICFPNYALLKLILKWVSISRESTHQLDSGSIVSWELASWWGSQKGSSLGLRIVNYHREWPCQPLPTSIYML